MNRFLSAVVLFSMIGCGTSEPAGPTPTVRTEDLVVGTGAVAANGNTVTVHYIGKLSNGTVFQDSHSGQPISFRLGANQVIPGFEQGIVGMRAGGTRRITIPPELAYGSQGNPQAGIPSNATIVFDVDLLVVQ